MGARVSRVVRITVGPWGWWRSRDGREINLQSGRWDVAYKSRRRRRTSFARAGLTTCGGPGRSGSVLRGRRVCTTAFAHRRLSWPTGGQELAPPPSSVRYAAVAAAYDGAGGRTGPTTTTATAAAAAAAKKKSAEKGIPCESVLPVVSASCRISTVQKNKQ